MVNVTKWEESFVYLKEINVVKICVVRDGYYVFLIYFRGYEKIIVRNFVGIMDNVSWVGNIEIDK